jgi:hypothetical protein
MAHEDREALLAVLRERAAGLGTTPAPVGPSRPPPQVVLDFVETIRTMAELPARMQDLAVTMRRRALERARLRHRAPRWPAGRRPPCRARAPRRAVQRQTTSGLDPPGEPGENDDPGDLTGGRGCSPGGKGLSGHWTRRRAS